MAMRATNLSLVTKLNLLLAVAAGVAFLVSCVAFVTNDIRMLRSAKINHLLSLADTLGAGSFEALAARDWQRAEKTLAALRAQANVVFGGLYDTEGRLVASYRHASAPAFEPPPAQARGHFFTGQGHLGVFSHVAQDGQQAGTIYVHASMEDLRAEMMHYVRIVALISVASLSSSVLLSNRLQRLVSAPIVTLTQTAQRISAEGDYDIRVSKAADDELGTLCDEFNAMLERIAQADRELHEAHSQLESRVEQRTQELSQANLKLSQEIGERQRAEEELAILHQKLVDAAHRAGMAEIATDVLHNVGNVLNSVNVSCTLAAERLRNSSVPQVQRVVELLDSQAEQLGTFLTCDERGRQVPEFLHLLAAQLVNEQRAMLDEMEALTKNVDHIKTIVAMQQSYAGVSGMVEPVVLAELLDDAVRLNASWIEKYEIEVVRQYGPVPAMLTQKQKLLQVLVNLVQNARDALIESGRRDPRLVLTIAQTGDDLVRIDVVDNGIGIPAENMTRIFAHGFTTKQTGHGFGLHSCANAAKEMGGRLGAASEGPGCGARFTLELPCRAVEVLV